MIDTNHPKARFWGNLAKWGFLIGACAFLAPIVWLAVGGLIGLILFVGIALGAWMLRPAVFTLAASTRIKLLKMAAAVNPAEELQEEYRRRSAQLDERKKGIEQQVGANKAFKRSIDEIREAYPDDPALPGMIEDHAQLVQLEGLYQESWQASYAELLEFKDGIRRAEMLFNSANLQAKARGASKLSQTEFEAQLKTQVAFDTIRQRFDSNVAAISTERMQLEAEKLRRKKQLPPSATAAIDMTDIKRELAVPPPAPGIPGIVTGQRTMPPGRDDLPHRHPGRTNA